MRSNKLVEIETVYDGMNWQVRSMWGALLRYPELKVPHIGANPQLGQGGDKIQGLQVSQERNSNGLPAKIS